MSPKDQKLLERIILDDERALEEVYVAYQLDFLRMSRKYGLDSADALDIYQDAVVSFYQQAQRRAMVITTSIRAYLLGIARYKCYELLRQQQRSVPLTWEDQLGSMPEEPPSLSYEQEQLRQHFTSLSASCQEVLRLFYYRGLSLEEIVAQTEYKNAATVKSHKSRCLKRLSEMIKK